MRFFRQQALTTLCLLLAIAVFGGVTAVAQDAASDKKNEAKEVYNQGLKDMQEGNMDKAKVAFQLAITADDQFVDAHINLGVIHFEERAYDLALEQFEKAVEIDPENVDALANLGRVQYLLKDRDGAAATYEAALKIKPGDADLLKELGKTYYQSKAYDKAIETLKSCHESGTADHLTWFMLGKAYEKTNNDAQAVAALKESIALKPDYYNSRSALGSIYLQQEKYGSAAAQFKAAMEAAPKRHMAAYNYAVAMESADPDAMSTNIANWEAYIRLAKNNPRARNNLNVATQHVKDLKERKEAMDLE